MAITRRHLLQSGAAAAMAPALGIAAGVPSIARRRRPLADGLAWRHALSLFGDIKYPADFKRFDYVNPDAPKGGVARQISIGTFDNFNIVGRRHQGVARAGGDADLRNPDDAVAGRGRRRNTACWPEASAHPEDFSWVIYRLRKEARWHDGKPVTPEDVIFSFERLEAVQPDVRFLLPACRQGRESPASATSSLPSMVRATVNCRTIVGELPVLPKHWWEGTDSQGRKRDISATTLEPPLGSGPYRIKEFVAGRSVALERVKDYWGAAVPAQVGPNNFDELRFEFFRDNLVALEAFKADQADWISREFGQAMGDRLRFPGCRRQARHQGRISRSMIRDGCRPSSLNLRRDQFKDARLRRAFNYAFDFEEMNRQLFFGQYKRINSYFDGTELASSGLPEGRELQILEAVRDKVPPEVFTTPYTNPVGGNPEAVRANLRESAKLLKEAGFQVRDAKARRQHRQARQRRNSGAGPGSERIALFFKPSLERIGVATSVRVVDDAQYQNRIRSFDFDMIIDQWGESLSPGNEQREFWGSQAADQPGSRNTVGIKNPAVDALIEQVIFAKDRDRTRWPPPRRWTACCCGISMSCRSSPTASRVTPAGIVSAMPSRCRNTGVRDFLRCGGMMPKRRPRSAKRS